MFVATQKISLKYFQLNCVVVPSKALADPGELDRALTASLTSSLTTNLTTNLTTTNSVLQQPSSPLQ